MNSLTELQKLAEAEGIQTSYLNTDKKLRLASPETLRQILKVLGPSVSSRSDVSEALQQRKARRISQLAEPVHVCWQNTKSLFKFRASIRPGAIQLTLILEDGTTTRIHPAMARPLPAPAGPNRSLYALDLPNLPVGCHHLVLETEGEVADTLLLSAPRKFFAPTRGLRQWGAFAPMYAIHSDESWGAGNFSDWKNFTTWIAGQGGRVLGALPVLSSFLGYPVVEPSPYSPASRLFWNEFYLDVTAVPGFSRSPQAQRIVDSPSFKKKLAEFRASDFVNYAEQMKLRRQVLEVLAQEFFAADGVKQLNHFRKIRPEIDDYAEFRAACEHRKKSWHTWPDAPRNGQLGRSDFKQETKNFYLFIQWAAQQQMDSLLATCREQEVGFYLDLPLGVNPDSYDSWRFKDFFAQGASAGAPPDSFFTKGQDWGFAPLHPARSRELHYRYLIDYLRFQMRHTGMLRIDHVMSLHRLYWIPHGVPASQGAYVRYPAEELYAILSIESHRFKTLLIGENLGTVPPEVNKAMDRHGFRRMYVLQYEQQPDAPLPTPTSQVAASLNTHDMPTFAAHWEGDDILDRASLGLVPKNGVLRLKKDRDQLRQGLTNFLRKKKLIASAQPGTLEVLQGALNFLAASKAETVLVTIEDLWLEKRPQNTPGTSTERSNWTRKTQFTLEEMTHSPELQSALQSVNLARARRSRR